MTFHNQRDFIFVRHHRYIYRKEGDKTRAKLQELGPRFTLKLKWLQEGSFDTEFGEFEWMSKRKQMEIQQARKWQQMEIKVEELNNMRNEILEIKGLLQEVLNKKEL